MRFFTVIFSLYVCYLIALPCIDKHDENDIHVHELSQNNENDSDNHTNHCSPFCTCDCCVSPVLNNFIVVNFSKQQYSSTNHSTYTSSFNSSHFASIWQPPKLS